jgi:hypothetical protein
MLRDWLVGHWQKVTHLQLADDPGTQQRWRDYTQKVAQFLSHWRMDKKDFVRTYFKDDDRLHEIADFYKDGAVRIHGETSEEYHRLQPTVYGLSAVLHRYWRELPPEEFADDPKTQERWTAFFEERETVTLFAQYGNDLTNIHTPGAEIQLAQFEAQREWLAQAKEEVALKFLDEIEERRHDTIDTGPLLPAMADEMKRILDAHWRELDPTNLTDPIKRGKLEHFIVEKQKATQEQEDRELKRREIALREREVERTGESAAKTEPKAACSVCKWHHAPGQFTSFSDGKNSFTLNPNSQAHKALKLVHEYMAQHGGAAMPRKVWTDAGIFEEPTPLFRRHKAVWGMISCPQHHVQILPPDQYQIIKRPHASARKPVVRGAAKSAAKKRKLRHK